MWRCVDSSSFELLGVFQRDGRVAGQFGQGRFVVGGEFAVELVDHLEGAEQFALAAAQRHAEQRAGLIAQLAVDLAIDFAPSATVSLLTRRGWPVWTTWPTTPESSGMRSSPPRRPAPGRPTSMWLGRSQRKMLARSAPSSRVAASAICFEQRLHLVGLVPLAGDFQNRFQPAGCGRARAERGGPFRARWPKRRPGLRSNAANRRWARQRTVQQQQFAAGGMTNQRSGHPTAFDRRDFAIQHVGQQSDRQRPDMAPAWPAVLQWPESLETRAAKSAPVACITSGKALAEKLVDPVLLARSPEQIGRDGRQFGMVFQRLKAAGVGWRQGAERPSVF